MKKVCSERVCASFMALLVGVALMTMLVACGGGSGGSVISPRALDSRVASVDLKSHTGSVALVLVGERASHFGYIQDLDRQEQRFALCPASAGVDDDSYPEDKCVEVHTNSASLFESSGEPVSVALLDVGQPVVVTGPFGYQRAEKEPLYAQVIERVAESTVSGEVVSIAAAVGSFSIRDVGGEYLVRPGGVTRHFRLFKKSAGSTAEQIEALTLMVGDNIDVYGGVDALGNVAAEVILFKGSVVE
ncbi:MAG: hypothetical protein GXP10_10125 [Gammaproteobacteria bacterium]|nr:hypothetical protein [Gammaproteobacteria bacterium]